MSEEVEWSAPKSAITLVAKANAMRRAAKEKGAEIVEIKKTVVVAKESLLKSYCYMNYFLNEKLPQT